MTLEAFFSENERIAIALSGGVDSAYLLWAAKHCGADVRAYYVKTEFQPEFEYEDAMRLVRELGAGSRVLVSSVLNDEKVTANREDRCYHCKKRIFSLIAAAAAEDGYMLVCDGTNASDDAGDRPGMRAIRELRVRSPLRECGLAKEEIRRLSKEAGLFTWDKPAYACLATRIPAGETITKEKLIASEQAETYLFSLGFSDFRVRQADGHARIQIPAEDMAVLLEKREEIAGKLGPLFKSVSLDLEVRR
ncbi:MAG: ATP-dependent sacrificial sulfur transferase LarE [Lachnospiraceae bacterium]|nr:ATP-dependent sacrificial sulfur transferase LarE [Lachnospiraceae bacterium]